MSAFQQQGKKSKSPKKEDLQSKPEAVEEKPVIEEAPAKEVEIEEEKPVVAEASKPKPSPVLKKSEPKIEVDIPVLLRYIARIKTGRFSPYGNGGNFGNHMVKDCFTIDGKKIETIEEASQLVRPYTNVSS